MQPLIAMPAARSKRVGKIRILFLCNAPEVLGGVEKALGTLLVRINREKFEINFILNGFGPFYEQLMKSGAKPMAFKCKGRYSIGWHRFLVRQLKSNHYDVVNLTAPFPNTLLLKWREMKVVGRLNYPRMNHGLYPMRFRAFDKFCSRFVDAYVVVSRAIQDQFIARGYDAAKLHLIYNGIDVRPRQPSTLRTELGIDAGQLVIGTIGRMRHEKGMDLFLRAAAELCRGRENIHFVVAGDGEERSTLEAMAGALGLKEKIHFLGFRNDPLNVLGGFDLLLYLSRWEAFSNTIIEAMSIGVPVVASAVGGNKEAIRDGVTGLLVPPENFTAAAAAANALLMDQARRAAISSAAECAVREFSVDAMVQKHEALYEEIAAT